MVGEPSVKKPLGRPRVFDEDDVLDRVMQLFWDRGYHGASIADLTAAAGIGKQSLYKVFGDKRSMYLRALERYETDAVETAAAALRRVGDPDDHIRTFLSAPIEGAASGRGCFLCNASADQAAHDDATRSLVRRGFETMADALAGTLTERDRRTGFPSADDRARAWSLLSVYGGLQIMSRNGLDRAILEAVRDAALKK